LPLVRGAWLILGPPGGLCGIQVPARLPAAGASVAAASWLAAAWRSKPRADLGSLLRAYRNASGMTQQQLADLLGFDRTYISMIECGRRSVTDLGTLAHIASTLAVPPHVLGIAGHDDADFVSMLAFGTSVIRLAEIARHTGRAAEAVSELWPLITRLEARISAGHAEVETMRLLAQARASFGVAHGSQHAGRAASLFDAVGADYRRYLPPTDSYVLDCAYHAGHAYAEIGKPGKALAQLRFYVQTPTPRRTSFGIDSTQVRNLDKQIGRLRSA